jgi:nitrous oxide reductase
MGDDRSGDREKIDVSRRQFFNDVSGSAAVVAVSVASPLAATEAAAAEGKPEKTKARYKESEHVKTYYRTNRY